MSGLTRHESLTRVTSLESRSVLRRSPSLFLSRFSTSSSISFFRSEAGIRFRSLRSRVRARDLSSSSLVTNGTTAVVSRRWKPYDRKKPARYLEYSEALPQHRLTTTTTTTNLYTCTCLADAQTYESIGYSIAEDTGACPTLLYVHCIPDSFFTHES